MIFNALVVGHGPGSEAVVKNHSTVEYFFAKMIVCHAFDLISQLDQFEIVSRNQTKRRSLG